MLILAFQIVNVLFKELMQSRDKNSRRLEAKFMTILNDVFFQDDKCELRMC